jgi:shikimate dehydrogenase
MSSPAVQPLLALLASHVGGNPTQYMFERAFAHHDLDWRYLTFEIEPESLGDAVRGLRALGFRGAHCADPYKQAVLPCLDRTTETAAMVGSVNLIFRDDAGSGLKCNNLPNSKETLHDSPRNLENALVGENTEGKGVVQAIRAVADPAGKHVVLLGAGRVARAVAIELAAAGAAGITVVNRTESRASELVALMAGKFATPISAVAWQGNYAVPPETDILIHAIGLGSDVGKGWDAGKVVIPLLLDSLRPELLVADAAIEPRTWLLDEAAHRGCKTVDGLSMFIEQVAIGFQLWTGVDADRQVLHDAVEEFLEL